MSDDEIERNQQDAMFIPCSVCRSSYGIVDDTQFKTKIVHDDQSTEY